MIKTFIFYFILIGGSMAKAQLPKIQIAGAISTDELMRLDQAAAESTFPVSVGLLYGDSEHMNEPALPGAEIRKIVASGVLNHVSLVLITYFNTADQILNAIKDTEVCTLQLHGPIPEAELKKFRCQDRKSLLIKSLPIDIEISAEKSLVQVKSEVSKYEDYVDGFITDTQAIVEGELRFGATGLTHPRSISAEIIKFSKKPVIVAGGLDLDNVEETIQDTRAFGVDAHSSLEKPDIVLPKAKWGKDILKVTKFIEKSNEAFRSITQTFSFMKPKLTHVTFAVKNLDESIEFYRRWLGLEVYLDRRPHGSTVWITTPDQMKLERPDFVFVTHEGEISKLDHFGFQVDSREDIDKIAIKAKEEGVLLEGPIDVGGQIGTYLMIKDPNGHIWEYTYGQGISGL